MERGKIMNKRTRRTKGTKGTTSKHFNTMNIYLENFKDRKKKKKVLKRSD